MNSSALKGLAGGIGIGVLVVGAVMLMRPSPSAFTPISAEPPPAEAPAAAAAAAPTAANVVPAAGTTVEVFKTATCGCCGSWVQYMREQGFTVVVKDVSDDQLNRVNAANGVPKALESCHTALVHGYVVEGHVPAEDILRMLDQRPKIAGLTVPGMVQGPPGMASATPVAYEVLAFSRAGETSVYSKH